MLSNLLENNPDPLQSGWIFQVNFMIWQFGETLWNHLPKILIKWLLVIPTSE